MPRAVVVAALAAATLGAGTLVAPTLASAGTGPAYSWTPTPTGSTEHFRGLAAVSRSTAWVAGYDGTVLRTTDAGRTWLNVSPKPAQVQGTDGLLQFRDIESTNATDAVVMAAGEGTDSRILVTHNGGRTWRTTFVNQNAQAFFDCMAFFDPEHGLTMSDPVNGRFRILSTSDGGSTWSIVPRAGMPAALPGEAGFAASGTCLVTSGPRSAWFASGGGAVSRVFHTSDRGTHWSVTSTPIASSASAGIFSLAVRRDGRAVAVGGDYTLPDANVAVAGFSADGTTWKLSTSQPGGYRSGAEWVPGTRSTVLAVGLNGSDVSRDGGRTWTGFGTASYDTVQCAPDGACWASGDVGAVARLTREPAAS